MNIAIIINGKNIKKCKEFNELKSFLEQKFSVKIYQTNSVGDGINKTLAAIELNPNYIIIVGGDGTINEVVNGVMLSDNPRKPVIAIFPCGTGDDFVKSLRPQNLFSAISNHRIKEIDLIKIKYISQNNEAQTRYCVNIADIGVSALTVKIVNGSAKRLGSALTFLYGAIKSFLKYKPIKIKLQGDNFEYQGKITTVVFANGNFFGGGIGIAPKAKIDDGYIDIVIAGDISLWEFLRHYPTMRKSREINHKQIFYYRTKKLVIKPLSQGKFPVEADGEYIGNMPVEVEIVPKAVKFLI